MAPIDIAACKKPDIKEDELLKLQEFLRRRRAGVVRVAQVQGLVSRDVGF